MTEDIRIAADLGAQGVAIGMLNREGGVATPQLVAVVGVAQTLVRTTKLFILQSLGGRRALCSEHLQHRPGTHVTCASGLGSHLPPGI
jgi:hypothetical protein